MGVEIFTMGSHNRTRGVGASKSKFANAVGRKDRRVRRQIERTRVACEAQQRDGEHSAHGIPVQNKRIVDRLIAKIRRQNRALQNVIREDSAGISD